MSGRTPRDANASFAARSRSIAEWSDASKVLLLSGLTIPFALGWVLRLMKVAGDPSASPYINRAFLPLQIRYQIVQLVGHVVLATAALALRARGPSRRPWLVHAEIQLWCACAAISLYIVGPFTSSYSVLVIALPVIGYLIFEPAPMRAGLVTLGIGVGAGIALPQLGVVPYAPFLAAAPFSDGRLQGAFIAAVGVPSIFVACLAIAIHASLVKQLHARRAELEITSSTDPLTGLANRLVFFRRLDEEVSRAKRHGHALCLMMVDADHFKAINDTHGHLVGDEVLRRLGAALRDTVRIDDVAARYGGEEFAILLPHTTLEEATRVADRLLGAVRAIVFDGAMSGMTLTVSASVVCLGVEETADALLARADAALYEAKHEGRDRVAFGVRLCATP